MNDLSRIEKAIVGIALMVSGASIGIDALRPIAAFALGFAGCHLLLRAILGQHK